MTGRARVLAVLVAPALLAGAGEVTAQACASAPSAALAGGYVTHAVAGGTSGTAVGLDLGLPIEPASVRVEYRHTLFERDAPASDAIRGLVRVPLLALGGVAACGDVHAGASRFSLADDNAVTLAGGLGITLTSAGGGVVRPFASVRGLGGYITGRVLDEPLDATGFAVGVEAGVQVSAGRFSLRLSAARDGFDDGLGVTPFPETAFELALGLRF